MTTSTLPPDLPPAKKSRGCLFWGAIIAVVLLLVFGVGGYLAFRFVVGRVVTAIHDRTETVQRPVSPETLDPAAYPALEQRIRAFGDALDAGTAAEPLVLTGEELDAWVRHQTALRPPSQVHLDIQGDQITAELSLLLDDFLPNLSAFEQLRGRFLNADAKLVLLMNRDRLEIEFRSIEIKGEELDHDFRRILNEQDLLGVLRRRAAARWDRKHLESIDIADGRLTITGKPR
ncbi:MAG: hypothetical protein U1E73_11735 [Planctomycetota bacterium]